MFSNFTARDEGKSRRLVARFEREEDARLGALAPDLYSLAVRAETMLGMLTEIPAAQLLFADLQAATAKARGDA